MLDRSVEQAWKAERTRIVGGLARRFGDLGLAEDATQEAFLAAEQRWPLDGEPEQPGAWLQTTAYRKAIGMLRKTRPTTELDEALADAATPARSSIDDDFLGLLLACCHPALDAEARVALTLRHVSGLGVAEIAAAFVVNEATMAKRLVRARAKIRDAKIPFTVPEPHTVRNRLDDIHTVIYVVFTEGHLASTNGTAIRIDLCEEAIWLAQQVIETQPASDETKGLLALLHFHHARRATRLDDDAQLVPIDRQDRSHWDQAAIEEGRRLLADPNVTTLGPYRVEAAIAALHVADDGPDWPRIADLYGVLSRLAPSPIIEINRSIAVGHADGPHAGLAIIEPVLHTGRLEHYPPAQAAHAELLEQAGNLDDAAHAWRRAAYVSNNETQRTAMTARSLALKPD